MNKKVTIESYVYTKNVIYQLYPVLVKLSDKDLEEIFSTFGKLEDIARNTYYFPYDIDLLKDMKNLSLEQVLSGHLSQKYNVDNGLLTFKYHEYHLCNLSGLLVSSDILDIEAMEKFNFEEKLQNRESDIENLPKK